MIDYKKKQDENKRKRIQKANEEGKNWTKIRRKTKKEKNEKNNKKNINRTRGTEQTILKKKYGKKVIGWTPLLILLLIPRWI